MVESLLTTKLYIPPLRPSLVPRPRLAERLTRGTLGKLTLVSAPAGFGKTTLLSEWIHRRDSATAPLPVTWLSLDENDSSLPRFITYLVAALQQIDHEIGATLPLAIGSDQELGIETLLTTLINEISIALSAPSIDPAHPKPSFVLVLDDYHAIDSVPVHKVLNFLIDHIPPQMHLIIASRTDPPLPLSRLRARNQLTELRSADLRFTLDEAAAFLNQVMLLGLSAADVAALEKLTEGWIAGLQMAALSMRGQEDIQNFVKTFSGSHRYILDYLADEVFDRQPEAIQTFLLKTAILDRLTGSLCDALLGQEAEEQESGGGAVSSPALLPLRPSTDGQKTLEYLERSNLFVVPLDDNRRWYRYHPLFADLLRYRLSQSLSDHVPGLHRRACEWYAQNGLVFEAIGHALAAGDSERAARLVEEADPTIIVMRGEVTTLLGWLDALPDEVVRSRPRLSLSYAWALLVIAKANAIEPRVQDTLRALGIGDESEEKWPDDLSAQMEGYLGEIAALRAFVAICREDAHRAIELARQALARLPQDNLLIRGAVNSFLGDAYCQIDDIAAASQAYTKATAYGQALDHSVLTLITTNDLARLWVVQGKLRQAAKTFRQVLQWGGGRRRPLYPVERACIGLGDLLREWNDLDNAENYLTKGIAQCELGGYAKYLLFGYIALAQVKQARRDRESVIELVQKAEQTAEKTGVHQFMARVAAHRTRLSLSPTLYDLPAAMRWARTCGLNADGQPAYAHEIEYLTLARVLLAEGRVTSDKAALPLALNLLARLLLVAKTAGRMSSVIEILALRALTLQAQGQAAKAMIALKQALTLAEPEGYVRLFADEGAPMAELLRHAAARAILPDYTGRLLESLQVIEKPGVTANQVLVEPLTGRELEVLRLVAAGLSNREIAQTLSVTANTVKTHTRRIYNKLNVRNRTQAATRAREWNLLQ